MPVREVAGVKKATKLEVLRERMLRRLDSVAAQYQAARREYVTAWAREEHTWSVGYDRGFALAKEMVLHAQIQDLADALELAVPVTFVDGDIRVGGGSPMAMAARCDKWVWQEKRRKSAVAARLSLLTLPPAEFVGRYAERVLGGAQEVRA